MLKDYRIKINSLKKERELHITNKLIEESRLEESKQYLQECMEAQQILQAVSISIEESTHEKFAAIVTKCLQMVFLQPYVFIINFTRKRGKTDAEMMFKIGDKFLDPLESSGKGLVEVAAFALRLASISLRFPRLRPVLFLDEPFLSVDAESRPRVRQMLEMLSKELNYQLILVTHSDELQAGKVIKIK